MSSSRADGDDQPRKARAAAYRYLAGRPHSAAELRRKLVRRKFDEPVVDELIGQLSRQGYLDDEAVARRWAEQLVEHKHWGPAKVAAYLARRGIDAGIVARVQQEVWSARDEEDVARSALEKRFRPGASTGTPAKAAAFLAARGFSAEVVYRVACRGDEQGPE